MHPVSSHLTVAAGIAGASCLTCALALACHTRSSEDGATLGCNTPKFGAKEAVSHTHLHTHAHSHTHMHTRRCGTR
jgi:hypothetical protein